MPGGDGSCVAVALEVETVGLSGGLAGLLGGDSEKSSGGEGAGSTDTNGIGPGIGASGEGEDGDGGDGKLHVVFFFCAE